MARINLQVPFSEKDEAKRLGARWDPDKKVWYISEGMPITPFQNWLPAETVINVRSPFYAIAESAKECWKCGKVTLVYGFMLPAGHETLEETAADSDTVEWIKKEQPTTIYYVDYIPKSARNHISAITLDYRIDYSQATHSSYWMNHCQHCGMKQGDFDMYCEPGGAFCPMDEEDESLITVHMVHEAFEASCGGNSNDDVIII